MYISIYFYYSCRSLTQSKWKEIGNEFETLWQFPHCIGALDGKHVLIRPPPNSGSYYFNYKHSFSIVLLALVDADYKFTYVNIGCNGRVSDEEYMETRVFVPP